MGKLLNVVVTTMYSSTTARRTVFAVSATAAVFWHNTCLINDYGIIFSLFCPPLPSPKGSQVGRIAGQGSRPCLAMRCDAGAGNGMYTTLRYPPRVLSVGEAEAETGVWCKSI